MTQYPDKGTGWLPISEHKGDKETYDLAWYYEPSAFAAMNGSRPFWCYAEGSTIEGGGLFTGILGSKPSHFKPVSGDYK